MSSATPALFDRIADDVDARTDALVARDPRSDDRSRRVSLSRDRVTIDRRYRGIAMRLSVPVPSYLGVAVTVRGGERGGFVYELRLAHRDPELCVLLDEDRDEARIWAEWRASAGWFGLPALIERNGGPEPWGALSIAPARPCGRRAKRRSRPGIVAHRVTRPDALGIVHREHEIIARD
jgi:hypothetical protein